MSPLWQLVRYGLHSDGDVMLWSLSASIWAVRAHAGTLLGFLYLVLNIRGDFTISILLFSWGQSTEARYITNFFIDLKATVGTYELRSYGGEQ